MSDSDELDLDDGDSTSGGAQKKTSGLAALLPNLLKFVAIGLGAVIFIITVSVITHNILNRAGRPQTVIPIASPFIGERPTFSAFDGIGPINTHTNDPVPFMVMVNMVLLYDLNDAAAFSELNGRLHELRDFTLFFFRGRRADELRPENVPRIRREIMEHLNTRVLNSARVRDVMFSQFDVMQF
jgi:flagellar FliL protein